MYKVPELCRQKPQHIIGNPLPNLTTKNVFNICHLTDKMIRAQDSNLIKQQVNDSIIKIIFLHSSFIKKPCMSKHHIFMFQFPNEPLKRKTTAVYTSYAVR